MKLTIFIFLFLLSSLAHAQEIYPYERDYKTLVLGNYNYVYNSSNLNYFEHEITSLVAAGDPDSSFKATKIMWGLLIYDTAKYSLTGFRPLLNEIIRSNTAHFENNLIGEWRFSHDFWTGMVAKITTTTAIDTGKLIRLDGHTAYFYFNDSLFRKTPYKVVVRKQRNEFNSVNNYSIAFDDNKENWAFSLKKNYYGSKMIMTVYVSPNCSCGCETDIYKKVEFSGIEITKNEAGKNTILQGSQRDAKP